MSGPFEGKQYVVTGAAGGIGRLCARDIVEGNGRVLLVDIDPERLAALQAELGGGSQVTTCVSALGDPRETAAVLDAAGRPINGIVHMAGLFEPDPMEDHAVWDRAMAANLTNGYDLALAYKSRRDIGSVGRIVFCSSGAARRGAPGRLAYTVAKAGIVGLTRGLAREFAPHTLVNAVAPNAIRTTMTTKVFEERGTAIMAMIPLGRFGEPEEISAVVTFLLGAGASYMTGQTLNIDGGASNS